MAKITIERSYREYESSPPPPPKIEPHEPGFKDLTHGAVGGTLGTVAGFLLGGPIGAAIGAAIGGIGGFHSGHAEDQEDASRHYRRQQDKLDEYRKRYGRQA